MRHFMIEQADARSSGGGAASVLETPVPAGGTRYVALLAGVAALGGLLFGYDTAVISGTIGFLKTKFALTELEAGWAASSALVGCIGGATVAGALSDWLGRKRILLLAAVLFTVSAVWSSLAGGLNELAVARILGGMGVGMASMLSPLYIAEVSPARIRGRMVSVNQLAIVSGMLVVYFVNAIIASAGNEAWNVETGWRWMFASETLPAMLFFGLLFLVPESPRWLTKQGRRGEALAVLGRVGGIAHATREMVEIEDAIASESGSISELLRPGLRVALIIGVGLAILQQVTGINTVLYYAPEIFKSTGAGSQSAINATVVVGAVNVLFTLVAIWVVDRLGRKPLLLAAAAGMGVSLAGLGWAMLARDDAVPAGWWVLAFVLVYVASFAVAMGPVVWVIMSEIFPTRVRGRAMSIATVCLWIACYLVSQFFLPMLKWLGGGAFFVYAAMCVAAFVFVGLLVPETKGKSLEEIERGWRR
jgi:MFS transporter, SP family, arabinose:H+ symporter